MVRSIKHLERFETVATDGAVGDVVDFLFDDDQWAVRYLVVDSEPWLPRRQVLVSPIAVAETKWGEQRLRLSVNRDQVANSPDFGAQAPISREHEMAYLAHYGYPSYWGGDSLWGAQSYPTLVSAENAVATEAAAAERRASDATHELRSAGDVAGCRVRASDGSDLGEVVDLLVDDRTWAIRYIVLATSKWWFGRKVLISSAWIDGLDWHDRSVSVGLTRAAIQNARSTWTSSERPLNTRPVAPRRAATLSEHVGHAMSVRPGNVMTGSL